MVPGRDRDYTSAHPTTALLVVEVADASLHPDRITKAAIYASAGIPEYWIVNLRNGVVEVMAPIPTPCMHATARWRTAQREERLAVVALPGATVAADDLLPITGHAG